jgi:hypothetical protein
VTLGLNEQQYRHECKGTLLGIWNGEWGGKGVHERIEVIDVIKNIICMHENVIIKSLWYSL